MARASRRLSMSRGTPPAAVSPVVLRSIRVARATSAVARLGVAGPGPRAGPMRGSSASNTGSANTAADFVHVSRRSPLSRSAPMADSDGRWTISCAATSGIRAGPPRTAANGRKWRGPSGETSSVRGSGPEVHNDGGTSADTASANAASPAGAAMSARTAPTTAAICARPGSTWLSTASGPTTQR